MAGRFAINQNVYRGHSAQPGLRTEEPAANAVGSQAETLTRPDHGDLSAFFSIAVRLRRKLL